MLGAWSHRAEKFFTASHVSNKCCRHCMSKFFREGRHAEGLTLRERLQGRSEVPGAEPWKVSRTWVEEVEWYSRCVGRSQSMEKAPLRRVRVLDGQRWPYLLPLGVWIIIVEKVSWTQWWRPLATRRLNGSISAYSSPCIIASLPWPFLPSVRGSGKTICPRELDTTLCSEVQVSYFGFLTLFLHLQNRI